ncbi:MAG TPA: HD domain-containing protein, partial [Acidimicrobiales bacterium]|nr:HD domain-containing protein [Acidimicrobiales bacterium]
LAKTLGADEEVVVLAAWLHDLAAVRDPTAQPDHALLGAELAPQILTPYGYAEATIGSVARAIASHSFPLAPGGASPEEVCLSQADGVAQMLRPFYWLYFATSIRALAYQEARSWLAKLLASKWEALLPAARRLVGQRYEVTLELLGCEPER